eukprot:m.10284 g.10284  ORF g.10284 m.10284 type:complete len:175 (-) comp3647_c0_seq1:1400-1924(-)
MRMGFVWKLVEIVLLVEVVFVFLLCIPFSAVQKSIITIADAANGPAVRKGIIGLSVVLVLLFADAFMSVNKYAHHRETNHFHHSSHRHESPEKASAFYAQRNLHIAGFCLILLFVIYRLLNFISERHALKSKVDTLQSQLDIAMKKPASAATTTTTTATTADASTLRHRGAEKE